MRLLNKYEELSQTRQNEGDSRYIERGGRLKDRNETEAEEEPEKEKARKSGE